MRPFQFPLRVYIEDTDIGGIVYYVNYLKFMERARTELLRALGFEQHRLKAAGLLFVVHSLESRYLSPARLDDELIVETTIKALASASLVFQQRVVAADGRLLCRADVKVVAVQAERLKPTAIPKPLAESLAGYRAGTDPNP